VGGADDGGKRRSVSRDGEGFPGKDKLSPEEYRRQVEMYRRTKLLQMLTPPGAGGTNHNNRVSANSGLLDEHEQQQQHDAAAGNFGADRFSASYHHLVSYFPSLDLDLLYNRNMES
jgi:hypothetical protein